MLENNLITMLLSFHQAIATAKSSAAQGRQVVATLCNLLTENDVLKRGESSNSNPPYFKSLYSYSINEVVKQICSKMQAFEASYLLKLAKHRELFDKIANSLSQLSLAINEQWLSQSHAQFRFALFQLLKISLKIAKQFAQQFELIHLKWGNCLGSWIAGQKVGEDLKFLLLHISFQTCLDSQLLSHWDQLMTSLQHKRYK